MTDGMDTDYERLLHAHETDLSVLTWMLGCNLAMTTAILFKLFS
jgi:hypothetical protein